MKWKHILVTTDLSEESGRAFGPIAELAKESGAKITLLHVLVDLRVAPVSAPLAPPVSVPDLDEEMAAAQKRLAIERSRFGNELDVNTDVVLGEDIPRAIAKWAKTHSVELIALSTHGRSGFKRMILGSVAEAILHHAHVPVLCFPKPE
ncbi:MAG: universal stress protein [Planctomycetota bacterium]|nr:universal stress protein [Planctomycetota bacterium]